MNTQRHTAPLWQKWLMLTVAAAMVLTMPMGVLADDGTGPYRVELRPGDGTGDPVVSDAPEGAFAVPRNSFTHPDGKLFAGFAPLYHRVTLHYNHSSNPGLTRELQVMHGATVTLSYRPQDFDWDDAPGFTMSGWSDEAAGQLLPQDGDYYTHITITEDADYYALWATPYLLPMPVIGSAEAGGPGFASEGTSDDTAQLPGEDAAPDTDTDPAEDTDSDTESDADNNPDSVENPAGSDHSAEAVDSRVLGQYSAGVVYAHPDDRVPGALSAVDVTHDMVLVAQWRDPGSYTVTFEAGGGSGAMGSYHVDEGGRFDLPPNGFAAPAGKVFAGFVLKGTDAPGPLTVTYDPNGGEGGPFAVSADAGAYTVLTPEAAGISHPQKVFAGWNTAADGTGTAYRAGVVLTLAASLTLHAQWDDPPVVPTYTVTYHANEGTGGPVVFEIPEGDTHTVLTPEAVGIGPPQDGETYTFTGWNHRANGNGHVTYVGGEEITDALGDVDLYAQWEAVPTYTVTYDPNGGAGGSYADTGLPAGPYTVLDEVAVGISHTGWTFRGWNTQADGSGEAYAPGDVLTLSGNVTLYAQWEAAVTYTVTYDPNGGAGGFEADNLTAGSQYRILSDYEAAVYRPDWLFAGYWTTGADGSGTTYWPDDVITIDENLVLYAQWEPTYTVTYDPNRGSGGRMDSGLPMGFTYTVMTADEAQVGAPAPGGGYMFNFIGWNTQADGSGIAYAPGNMFNITEHVTLFAQWEPIPAVTVTYHYNHTSTDKTYVDVVPLGRNYIILSDDGVGFESPGRGIFLGGWKTEPSGFLLPTYIPGDTIFSLDRDYDFYAQWMTATRAPLAPGSRVLSAYSADQLYANPGNNIAGAAAFVEPVERDLIFVATWRDSGGTTNPPTTDPDPDPGPGPGPNPTPNPDPGPTPPPTNPNENENFLPDGGVPLAQPGLTMILDDGVPLEELPGTGAAGGSAPSMLVMAIGLAAVHSLRRHWPHSPH